MQPGFWLSGCWCVDGYPRRVVDRLGVQVDQSVDTWSCFRHQEAVMLENIIWGFFIAIPALLIIAAIVATVRSNRLDFEEDDL